MIPCAVVVAAALSAQTTWSVAVTRRVGLDAARGTELAEQLARALADVPGAPMGMLVPPAELAANLAKGGVPDAAVCAGVAACVANLGRAGKVDLVVAVQLVKLGADLAVDATLVDARKGAALGAVTETLPVSVPKKRLDALAAKVAALAPALPPEPGLKPAPPPEDAPRVEAPRLAPEVTPAPPPIVEAAPRTSPLRYVAYGLGAGAIVSAGLGAGFGASALVQSNGTHNTDADFVERRERAYATARAADICFGIAGALAVGAVVSFVVSMP